MASTSGTIFTLTILSLNRTDASLTESPFFPLHLCSKASQEPAMSTLLGRNSYIRRALYRKSWPVQNMSIDHGGGDIRMSQELLDCPDVIIRFKQVLGKGLVKPRRFCNGSKLYLFDLGEADPPWLITYNVNWIEKPYLYCNLRILKVNR